MLERGEGNRITFCPAGSASNGYVLLGCDEDISVLNEHEKSVRFEIGDGRK